MQENHAAGGGPGLIHQCILRTLGGATIGAAVTADDKMATAAMRAAAVITAILMSEEEELMLLACHREHKVWTRSWISDRDDKNQNNTMFKLQKELELKDHGEFRVMMRMPPHVFGELLERVRPYITKQNTNYRKAVSAEERLSLTLRHMALGDCYASLAEQYRIGRCTAGRIVSETCQALFDCLRGEFLKTPRTTEEWLEISAIFRYRWNFPHLLGAVDGKHIRIVAPPKSGSLYFNYQKYFSVVLLAIADGNYEFIYIDTGAEGRTSDAGYWQHTPFCQALKNGTLNIPAPSPVPGCEGVVPYMVVADDAFPLGINVIKPYSHRDLEVKKQIFNLRLSRARRVVENAFGIMATRFRIFHQEIGCRPENVTRIVLAAVVLHNMLRRRVGASYIPRGSVDFQDEQGQLVPGEWRMNPAVTNIGSLQASSNRNQSQFAKKIRNNLANYFLSPEGEMQHQYRAIYV